MNGDKLKTETEDLDKVLFCFVLFCYILLFLQQLLKKNKTRTFWQIPSRTVLSHGPKADRSSGTTSQTWGGTFPDSKK